MKLTDGLAKILKAVRRKSASELGDPDAALKFAKALYDERNVSVECGDYKEHTFWTNDNWQCPKCTYIHRNRRRKD